MIAKPGYTAEEKQVCAERLYTCILVYLGSQGCIGLSSHGQTTNEYHWAMDHHIVRNKAGHHTISPVELLIGVKFVLSPATPSEVHLYVERLVKYWRLYTEMCHLLPT